MLVTAGLFLLAYLAGSIPSGYVLVRVVRGVDVRAYGSKNVGAINVCRVGGLQLAAATLLADLGKAVAIVALAAHLHEPGWSIATAAFLVMVGHAYSAWFYLRERRFSEGKCVASGLGVLVGLGWIGMLSIASVLLPLVVWLAALVGPRLVSSRWPCISPATMLAALSVPLAVSLSHPPGAYSVLSVAMAALILWRHKRNIERLLAGTEPRLGDRLQASPEAGGAGERSLLSCGRGRTTTSSTDLR